MFPVLYVVWHLHIDSNTQSVRLLTAFDSLFSGVWVGLQSKVKSREVIPLNTIKTHPDNKSAHHTSATDREATSLDITNNKIQASEIRNAKTEGHKRHNLKKTKTVYCRAATVTYCGCFPAEGEDLIMQMGKFAVSHLEVLPQNLFQTLPASCSKCRIMMPLNCRGNVSVCVDCSNPGWRMVWLSSTEGS